MGGADLPLSRAWRKYGPPKLKILAVVEKEEAPAAEQRAVRVFGTMVSKGYNATPGGESPPTTVPRIAKKVSKALRGRKKSEEHRANIAIGKSKQMLEYFADPENRRAQSERIQAFCKQNPEFGSYLSRCGAAAKRGKPTSDATKTKMAEAHCLNWQRLTPEQRSLRAAKIWATRRERGTDCWSHKEGVLQHAA